jgi:hypothetical protein
MSNQKRRRWRGRLLSATLGLAIAGGAIVAATQTGKQESEPRPAGWSRSDLKRGAPELSAAVAGPKTTALRVTLRPDGFDPAEAVCDATHVMFFVDNGAFYDEPWAWRLERITGQPILEQSMERARLMWAGQLVLTPGGYILRVVERPEWACRITVHPGASQ